MSRKRSILLLIADAALRGIEKWEVQKMRAGQRARRAVTPAQVAEAERVFAVYRRRGGKEAFVVSQVELALQRRFAASYLEEAKEVGDDMNLRVVEGEAYHRLVEFMNYLDKH